MLAAFLGKGTEEKIKWEDLLYIVGSDEGLKKNVKGSYKVLINRVPAGRFPDGGPEEIIFCEQIGTVSEKNDRAD